MQNVTTKPHENAREKILEAAFNLFAVKGYLSTSVGSIAEEAALSKGLIYYYFTSKEDILNAIFELMMKESTAMFKDRDILSPRQLLKQVVSYSFNAIHRQTNVLKLIMALMAQPKVVKGLMNELETVRKEWMGELAKAFEALGYENPELEGYLLCSMLDGIALAYISQQNYPLREMQDFIEMKYNLNGE